MNTPQNTESGSSKDHALNRLRERVHGAPVSQGIAPWHLLPELPDTLPGVDRTDLFEIQGPIVWPSQTGGTQLAHTVRYWDGYIHPSWGRMPETVPGYGATQLLVAHQLLSDLENPTNWLEFSKSLQALYLRKGNRFGSVFNEVGESLQLTGVETHRLGLACVTGSGGQKERFFAGSARLCVAPWMEAKWKRQSFLGRALYHYSIPQNQTPHPLALPFQFKFSYRLSAVTSPQENPSGRDSRNENRDASYFTRRGFRGQTADLQKNLDLPFLEIWTQHELAPRSLEWEEAVALAVQLGLDAESFQRVCFLSIWVAGFLKQRFQNADMDLISGVLRWARTPQGSISLISLPALDELQIQDASGPLSLDFLLKDHDGTPWKNSMKQAQDWEVQPVQDVPDFQSAHLARDWLRGQWKRRVPLQPRPLSADRIQLASLLSASVARALGVGGFEHALPLSEWRKKERASSESRGV